MFAMTRTDIFMVNGLMIQTRSNEYTDYDSDFESDLSSQYLAVLLDWLI